MSTRPAALLAALVLAGSLAACGGDDDDAPAAAPSASAPASAAPAPASPEPSGAAPGGPGSPAPASSDFPGDTRPDTEEPTGAQLGVVAVRVARQEGFDRVVFELRGPRAGTPGWRVAYTDDPRAQGSGFAVDVDGAATLGVTISGVGTPDVTGVADSPARPSLPADLRVVEDVVLGGIFEGYYDAFIGVSAERPFTVRRLADPERVVVDVAH